MSKSQREPLAAKGAWAPFMCPACRGLFRAPTDRDGEIECPLCESKANLCRPSTVAPSPSSVAPLEKPLRRRRTTNVAQEQSWDRPSTTEEQTSSSKGVILTALFLFSILLMVGTLLMIKERNLRFSADFPANKPSQSNQASSMGSLDFSNSAPNAPSESGNLLELESSDLKMAREAASKFLNCESVTELAKLIRDPERVMPLVRSYYERIPFEKVGALEIDEDGVAQVSKHFASFAVVLKDYSSRPIAVELSEEGALVDWESWVGYCEIPWETFVDNKVRKTTEVRVSVQRAFYYNFSFRDDSQWVCFRLARSPDEPVVFGYLPVDSPILSKLPKQNGLEATFVLKVRFPDPAVSSNQVLIEEFIQSGWVLGL